MARAASRSSAGTPLPAQSFFGTGVGVGATVVGVGVEIASTFSVSRIGGLGSAGVKTEGTLVGNDRLKLQESVKMAMRAKQ